MRERTLAMLRYSVIVVPVLFASACATAQATVTRATQDPSTINRADQPPWLALIERERSVPLPSRDAQMLSMEERDKYEVARRLGSNIRQRCVGKLDENKRCTRTVPVLITAVEGGKYSGARNRPQLIAWIENLSADTTTDGLLPGKLARYAVVVDTEESPDGTRSGKKRREVTRVQIDVKTRAFYADFPVRKRIGHVFECHAYGAPQFLSEVDFRPCNPDLMYLRRIGEAPFWKGEIAATSLLTFAATAFEALDDPIWFSCSSGCCTTSDPW